MSQLCFSLGRPSLLRNLSALFRANRFTASSGLCLSTNSRGFATKKMASNSKFIDIIAHRGASGFQPGHTIPSYEEAIRAGCDWIELDVHPTKTGELVVTHDIEFSTTTNVATLYPERFTTKHAPCFDGEEADMEGFFVEDFEMSEIKRLSVHNQFGWRSLQYMGLNSAYTQSEIQDQTKYRVPGVQEVATFLQRKRSEILKAGVSKRKRHFGKNMGRSRTGAIKTPYERVFGETMERTYQDFLAGNDSSKTLTFTWDDDTLKEYMIDFQRFTQVNAASGFERSVYRDISKNTGEPIWSWRAQENPDVGLYIETKRPAYYNSLGHNVEEQLVREIEESGFEGPVIIQSFEEESLRKFIDLTPTWPLIKLTTFDELPIHDLDALERWMEHTATYADGIGPNKTSIIPDPFRPPLTSSLIESAHRHDMVVHPYTFRSDVQYLHRCYGGNASVELIRFINLGVNGVFTDFPDHAVYATSLYEKLQSGVSSDVLTRLFDLTRTLHSDADSFENDDDRFGRP